MKHGAPILLMLLAGCSTAPIADIMDYWSPGQVTSSASPAAVVGLPPVSVAPPAGASPAPPPPAAGPAPVSGPPPVPPPTPVPTPIASSAPAARSAASAATP